MFAKGKGAAVPSDGQAREKLALYVYEYLLHVGAQKSAQTFLSEIRWEKNITLGEPPGFLHSWWCVFWDLYCAAPERRDTCDHSSEAKAFHDYSAAAAPSPVLGNVPPQEGMPGGPMPPGFFQVSEILNLLIMNMILMLSSFQPFMSPRYAGGPRPPIRMGNQPPGGQALPPNVMDPTRPPGHPNLVPMQRMNPPRGMGPMGPGPQGPPGGAGGGCPPGTPIMPSPWCLFVISNFLTRFDLISPVITFLCPQFPMGSNSDGPMGGMEPHHMNGSLGSGDLDGLPKNSPNNLSGISNAPGTPRDDGELGGNFLHSFQNENYSPTMTMSV
uniref:LisH domain-containing protein n=1 Tax=Denticeps clupeoides TaxID=299321 RepID=A0AAY4BXE3_9TELE